MARLRLAADSKREFDRALCTPEEAAAKVESGDLLWIPSSHAPPAILAAIAAREPELSRVKIQGTMISPSEPRPRSISRCFGPPDCSRL